MSAVRERLKIKAEKNKEFKSKSKSTESEYESAAEWASILKEIKGSYVTVEYLSGINLHVSINSILGSIGKMLPNHGVPVLTESSPKADYIRGVEVIVLYARVREAMEAVRYEKGETLGAYLKRAAGIKGEEFEKFCEIVSDTKRSPEVTSAFLNFFNLLSDTVSRLSYTKSDMHDETMAQQVIRMQFVSAIHFQIMLLKIRPSILGILSNYPPFAANSKGTDQAVQQLSELACFLSEKEIHTSAIFLDHHRERYHKFRADKWDAIESNIKGILSKMADGIKVPDEIVGKVIANIKENRNAVIMHIDDQVHDAQRADQIRANYSVSEAQISKMRKELAQQMKVTMSAHPILNDREYGPAFHTRLNVFLASLDNSKAIDMKLSFSAIALAYQPVEEMFCEFGKRKPETLISDVDVADKKKKKKKKKQKELSKAKDASHPATQAVPKAADSGQYPVSTEGGDAKDQEAKSPSSDTVLSKAPTVTKVFNPEDDAAKRYKLLAVVMDEQYCEAEDSKAPEDHLPTLRCFHGNAILQRAKLVLEDRKKHLNKTYARHWRLLHNALKHIDMDFINEDFMQPVESKESRALYADLLQFGQEILATSNGAPHKTPGPLYQSALRYGALLEAEHAAGQCHVYSAVNKIRYLKSLKCQWLELTKAIQFSVSPETHDAGISFLIDKITTCTGVRLSVTASDFKALNYNTAKKGESVEEQVVAKSDLTKQLRGVSVG